MILILLFRWPFTYGDDFLGSLATLGTFYITHYFRKELKLRPYARLTSYIPVVGLSAFGCYFFNAGYVTCNILRADSCPLCISTQASIGQLFFGLCYPLFMAPVVCFYLADKIMTYPVPPIFRAPREVFLLFSKLVRKNQRPFLVIGAMHMLSASIITFNKQNCIMNLELDSKTARKIT